MDSNLVNYLCDGGADISIINENLFNKLKINPQNEITPYQGNPLHSCSGEIRVLGTINIKELVIDPKTILHNIQMLATNHNSKHQCILGRDLIDKIPQLKTHLDGMKIIVKTMSEAVREYFYTIKKVERSNKKQNVDVNIEAESSDISALLIQET